MPTTNNTNQILGGLDIGLARIGVSVSISGVTIAKPLITIANDEHFVSHLKEILTSENISSLVIGLPRGLNGQETDQTKYVRSFVDKLKSQLDIPIFFQDEALTSKKAEDNLLAQNRKYEAGDIDALAASYILQDYLEDQLNNIRDASK